MRVALVHDWLTGMRGGEKCLEALCRIWPDAHLYTLVHSPGSVSPVIDAMDIRTSFLNRVPGVRAAYRYFLPAMPAAIESFRLDGYDLVVSLSHCVAKSVRAPRGALHVCYCFTPMRYAWHMREAYFGRPTLDLRSPILGLLRRWDRATASRVTHFIAISRTVADRIRECYGRSSALIHPPVDTDFYTPASVPRDDYYLCVSALAPYKRIDLAIEACNRLGRRLVVVGAGPQLARLRSLAGPTVEFAGWQPDEVLRDHYRRCRALLFPGLEDFGIVPLEAQACGAPVIAFGRGGATETVIAPTATGPGTGLLYDEQSASAMVRAMQEFEAAPNTTCSELARTNAARFCTPRFVAEIGRFMTQTIGARPQEWSVAA